MNGTQFDFQLLTDSIQQVHNQLAEQVGKAVNFSLTLRNWLIGYYIFEYEQQGADRAQYGDKLLQSISQALDHKGISRVEQRELRRYRQFYLYYPQIRDSVNPELSQQFLQNSTVENTQIRESGNPELALSGLQLVSKLSFTHFVELIKCDDKTKRLFYEFECIQGNWSVRELQRQISSLYYERSGLSIDKNKLSKGL